MAERHSSQIGDDVHFPKNMDTAKNGSMMWKNASGLVEHFKSVRYPDCLDNVDAEVAPPTENAGDVYVITNARGRQQIDTIEWQSGTTVRATFNVGHSLPASPVGMYILIENSAVSVQNGRFLITATAAGTIDYTNDDVTSAASDEASDSPAYGCFGHANWDGGATGDHVTWDSTNSLWRPVSGTLFCMCPNTTDEALETYKDSEWNTLNLLAAIKADWNGVLTTGNASAGINPFVSDGDVMWMGKEDLVDGHKMFGVDGGAMTLESSGDINMIPATNTVFTKGVKINDQAYFVKVDASIVTTYTADLSTANVFKLTMTGNTALDYSNAQVGTYIFHILGAFTLSFAASSFEAPGGATPTHTSDSIITGYYDGTKMKIVHTDDFQSI